LGIVEKFQWVYASFMTGARANKASFAAATRADSNAESLEVP
jgi:hypothetical protein